MKPKPIIAYAIVSNKKPSIKVNDIFKNKDVAFDKKTEKIIRVKISVL